MRSWRWYSKMLCGLLAGAFAWFVWPTPWDIHDRIRVNRFTGRTQVLAGNRGWTAAARPRVIPTQAEVTTGVIQAQGFQLVDENGAVRAVLSVQNGQPGLSLLDRAGNTRAALSMTGATDRPLLILMDSALNPRAAVGITESGFPEFVSLSPEGLVIWRAPY